MSNAYQIKVGTLGVSNKYSEFSINTSIFELINNQKFFVDYQIFFILQIELLLMFLIVQI
jgi:hypothetical protein